MLIKLILTLNLFIVSILLILFQLASSKQKMESNCATIFECGFSSLQMSRVSMDIKFYTIGLIFLLLDLEMVFVIIYMADAYLEYMKLTLLTMFLFFLMMTLYMEYLDSKLVWKN